MRSIAGRGTKGAGLLRRSKASWLRRLDCIILHWRKVLRNEADVAKSCDFFFANKSSFRTICISPIWFPPVRIRHYGKNIITPNMLHALAYQFFSHKVCFCLCKIEVLSSLLFLQSFPGARNIRVKKHLLLLVIGII